VCWAALLIALTACAAYISARICASATINGAISKAVHGAAVAPEPPSAAPDTSCAAIATAADGGNLGDHLGAVDAGTIGWDTSITDYYGPGDYRAAEFHLTVDSATYATSDGSDVDIDVGPDFATTITFSGLQSTGDEPSSVSGSISSTCIDPV